MHLAIAGSQGDLLARMRTVGVRLSIPEQRGLFNVQP